MGLLERLRKAVAGMVVETPDGAQISITISVGMAPLRDGMTPGSLVKIADDLLFTSKREGRDRVTCMAA